MEFKQVVEFILALVLIIVLISVGINPIRKVWESFKPIGEEESVGLTKLKEDCNKNPDETCSLDVAKQIVEQGTEDARYFEAQDWLKREIQATNNKVLLQEAFDFARMSLYPKSQDWLGAVALYGLLFDKLKTDDVALARDEAQIRLDVSEMQLVFGKLSLVKNSFGNLRPDTDAIGKNNLELIQQNQEQLIKLNKDAVDLYYKNKGKISDVPILGEGNCERLIDSFAVQASSFYLTFDGSTVCNQLSKESLEFGCYYQTSGTDTCTSCAEYGGKNFVFGQDLPDRCGGYDNKEACVADSCRKGNCAWNAGKCETQPIPGPTASPVPTPTP